MSVRIEINFASRDYVKARKAYLALCLCILAAAAVFALEYRGYKDSLRHSSQVLRRTAMLKARNKDTETRLAEVKKAVDAEETKAAVAEVDFANAVIRRRVFSWTAFLNRIEEVVPDGVAITALKPDFVSLSVDISGTADDMGRVTEFIDRLTKSQYFEDIPPTFHTSEVEVDKDIGKKLQEFNLKIRYNPEGSGGPAGTDGGKG